MVAVLMPPLFGCEPQTAERTVVPQEDDEVATVQPAAASEDNRPAVLFLGTSLTAGYGLADPQDAFPSLIEARIDSLGLDLRVVNGGVSGDTSAGGLDRLSWLIDDPVAILILELGANDGLRGLDPDAMERNLRQIISDTRARHPDAVVVLAGMEAPPNLGARYTDRFRQVFTDIAEDEDVHLIPFLLDGVAGVPALNQNDQIHPTVEGHGVIAATVWEVLAPLLEGL